MAIRLLSVDVGGVLGTAPSMSAALAKAIGCDPRIASAVVGQLVHSAEMITDEVIDAVAWMLTEHGGSCSTDTISEIIHNPGELAPVPGLREEFLQPIREAHPDLHIVLNSNVPVTASQHVTAITNACGGLIDDAYFSCETGNAKGQGYRAFTQLTQDFPVHIDEVLHVGDKWREDVAAPLMAGARALWITSNPLSRKTPAKPDRFRTVAELRHAAIEIIRWVTEDIDRNARLVARGSVLLRNQHGEILTVRAPGERWHYLPGGRCRPYGDDDPAQTASRELAEEVNIRRALTPQDLVHTAWSCKETRSDGSNKILFTFDAGQVHTDDIDVIMQDGEVADIAWLPDNDSRLAPRELERLQSIARGERVIFQRD